MKEQLIRTRFAPSPTGNLHIGGARTALFSYLLAKKNGGDFILRIEDTDLKRNKKEFVDNLNEDLNWLGLYPDESPFIDEKDLIKEGKYQGPYRQRDRIAIYRKYIDFLLLKKKAYYCFCSQQELQEEKKKYINNSNRKDYRYSRKCLQLTEEKVRIELSNKRDYLIRFLVDQTKSYSFNDLVRGNIMTKGKDMEDFVIFRSNQIPLYNFAATIDDHLMSITHVIRGEEHITNTSKQIALYDAFNWTTPKFIHLAIISDKDGKKLSKRCLESSQFQQIIQLREKGYLPEAINNYLLLIGWHPKTTKEFFSFEESLKAFNLEGLQTSKAVYNIDKLNWYNNRYIRKMPIDKFKENSFKFLETAYDLSKFGQDSKLEEVLLFFRTQINCFQDLIPMTKFFFEKPTNEKRVDEKEAETLKLLMENLEKLDKANWKREIIKISLTDIIEPEAREKIYPLIREILTQERKGPELPMIIFLLEKERVLECLLRVINCSTKKTIF